MNHPPLSVKHRIAVFLFLLCSTALAYIPAQGDFAQIIALYAPAFITYLWIYQHTTNGLQIKWMLAVAILARLLIMPSFPLLSDDIFRFVWDGRLIVNGINPFEQLPLYYMQPGNEVAGLDESLFEQLNSPEYFTIYPPVAQGIFALAAFLFRESIPGAALLIKVFLFFCEVGSILLLPALLRKLQLPEKNALLYALNPLVIIEVVGNLHFEGAMVFFLLLAFWWILQERLFLSALAMSLSIAAKLLPLIFLFFFIRRLGWKRALIYFSLMGMVLVLLFAPLLGEAFFAGFGSSLDLYFRRFEFNASLFYLVRWVGYQVAGFNLIQYAGPIMAMLVFWGVIIAALRDKQQSWASIFPLCLLAICLYLALTTTIHPWYSILPLLLCAFTRFRFPVLWTGLIMLTYINYSDELYRENLWVVLLEYILLYTVAIWELIINGLTPNFSFKGKLFV